MHPRHRGVPTVLLALAASACGSFVGTTTTVVEPALIIFYRDTARITAPDTVERGMAFEVRVQTFAGGCTRQIARTEVRVDGAVAEVRPYNRTRVADVCTSDLLFLEHRATVRLASPGVATIRVVGEQRGASGGTQNAPAHLERRVIVR